MSYGAAHLRKQIDKEAKKREHKDMTFSTFTHDWKGATESQTDTSAKDCPGDVVDPSTLIEEMVSKPVMNSLHRDGFRPLGLADALHQNHAALEGGKLSLVGCYITNISELTTSKARGIHTVYLSNNDIVSLNGLTQFNELRNLSLCSNNISYLGQLKVLGDLEHLEKLSLEGNTVASMPFYRLSVVGLCRHLVQLDGVRVGAEERSLANTAAREIGGYFERLRVSELRRVVLQHLSGVMRLHRELHEFLRPPDDDMGKAYAQQMMSHCPSDALRILVEGEVYRWLQISAADTFDCIVQDTARSLHLQMVQSLGAGQRTQMLRSPRKLFQHWKDVIDSLLRHQDLASSRLFNECEVCKGGEKKLSPSDPTSPVIKDLGVLPALHFHESIGDREMEVGYYGRRLPAGQRQSLAVPAPAGKELAVSMSQRYKRLLEAKKEDIGAEIRVPTSSSMTNMLPPQQSEPESPEKGPRPPMPGPDLALSGASPLWVRVTSGEQSGVHTQMMEKGHDTKAGVGHHGKHKEHGLDSMLDFSDERVVGFLKRALDANNAHDALQESHVLGMDVVGEWLHAYADARAMVKLDADVPVAIRLGPAPMASEDSPAPARSMAELKDQVQAALTALTQRQRDGYMSWSICEALCKQGSKVRGIMNVAVERVNHKLDLYYQMTRLLRDDVENGLQWVQNMEPLLKEVQEGKEALARLKGQMEESELERQRCVTLKAEEVAKKRSLLSSIHEANQAISSMSSQLHPRATDGRPRKKIKKMESVLDRVEELEGRSLLLMTRVLRHWKFNTYKRSKTRLFYRSMWPRYRKHLKKHIFLRWKGVLKGLYSRRLVQLKSQTRVLTDCFSDWHFEFVSTRTVRVYLRRKTDWAKRHVFRQFERLIVAHKGKVRDKRKKAVIVTCFTMIRLFRAWKMHYIQSRLTPLEEARGTLKASTFRLRHRLLAWRRVAEGAREARGSLSSAVHEVLSRRLLQSLFVPWKLQFQCRNFSRAKLCISGLRALTDHARSSKLDKFSWMWAEQFLQHKLLYYHRKYALSVLRRVTARTKKVRLAAEKVVFRKRRRTLLGIWYHMHSQSEKSRGLVGLTNALWEKDSKRTLESAFRHWLGHSKQQVEQPPPSHYFDEETAEEISLVLHGHSQLNQSHSRISAGSKGHDHDKGTGTAGTTSLLTTSPTPRAPADAKAIYKKKGLIKFRGRLLTREEVELSRLEHLVDEDYKALAGRYHSRKMVGHAWTTWRGRIWRSRLLRLRSDSVHHTRTKRCKARHWSVIVAMWLRVLMAKRHEASKDRGISALDTERSRLLRECATFRQQISQQQERSHYLGKKDTTVTESLSTAESNLRDTQHSVDQLKIRRDQIKSEISRLKEEAQTIRILAEGLESPDASMRHEVDKELESMLHQEEQLRDKNAKMLLDVETKYGHAVQVKLDSQREQARLHAEAEALLEVTRAQTAELVELEQRLQGLRSEKERDEAHIAEYSEELEQQGKNTAAKRKTFRDQVSALDEKIREMRSRHSLAQQEERELRSRLKELHAAKSKGLEEVKVAQASQSDDVVEMTALQHVTSTRAELESALAEVTELARVDEILAGDDFTRSMVEMQEKSLHSFLVPLEHHQGDGPGAASSFSEPDEPSLADDEKLNFLHVAAEGLDRINMSALDLLMDNGDSDNEGMSIAGSQIKAQSKRNDTERRPARKLSSAANTTSSATKRFENVRSKVDSGNRRRAKKVARKKEKEVEPQGRSQEVLNREIDSISERLKGRLRSWE